MATKIKIATSNLLEVVSKASAWANKKSPLPAVTSIRFKGYGDTLEIMATDGFASDISLYIPVESTDDFDFCLPSDKITPKVNILAKISDTVDLSVVSMVTISAKGHKSRMSTISSDNFPVVERGFDFSNSKPVDADDIVSSIKRTVGVVDPKTPFPALAGVFFNGDDVVSADGTKISLYSNMHLFEEGTLIHAVTLNKIAKAINKVGDVLVARKDKRIGFAWDGGIISAGIITYDFPDYTKLLPSEYKTRFAVSKDDIFAAIGLAASDVDENNLLVMSVNEEGLTIEASSSVGRHRSDIVLANYDGPEQRFGISYRYLRDAVSKIVAPFIYFGVNSSNDIIVVDDNHDYMFGIMPMSINE